MPEIYRVVLLPGRRSGAKVIAELWLPFVPPIDSVIVLDEEADILFRVHEVHIVITDSQVSSINVYGKHIIP